MRIVTPIALATAAVLSGCTSLQTMPDNFRTERRDQALEGIPYALPMRQFDLVATWTVDDCANRPRRPSDTKPPETSIGAELDATPVLTPGERYVVDYSALGSVLKTTDFAIETYPEGTLKSINATADDRSAETLVALAKTAASLASWGAGGGDRSPASVPLVEEGAKFLAADCSSEALAQLAKVLSAQDLVDAETANLKQVTRQVEQLSLAGMLDATKRAELAKQLEALRKSSGALDAATKKLVKARKPLQLSRSSRWPQDFSQGGEQSVPLSPIVTPEFGALFVDGAPATEAITRECLTGYAADDLGACLAKQVEMQVRLEPAYRMADSCRPVVDEPMKFACRTARASGPPVSPGQNYSPEDWSQYQSAKAEWHATTPTDARDHRPDKGLFVRPPELARLVVCRWSAFCDPSGDYVVEVSDWVSVPQLGQLRFLPFTNRMFENNALVLQLGKDGTLEKFQYATKAAIAERLATAASGIADAANGGRKAWREERAARRAEQLALLDQQIALADKQGKVAAIGAPPAPATVEDEAEQAQRIALKLEIEIEDRLVEAGTPD